MIWPSSIISPTKQEISFDLAKYPALDIEVQSEIIQKYILLDPARSHQKVLLYFDEETVYGANDKDSDALNKILGWPPHSQTYEEDDECTQDEGKKEEKTEAQFKKVREVLKGKQVDGVKKWLTDRGYVLPEDSDMAAISDQASIRELAGIHERISKKLGKGR
ncbi:hypothetical protein DL95DRAFT_413381 [Leptodontidium sp. 2 PMI_412]|nr:hypothetical protein DL95DRAFT_413381 [Leptodontidium sp. 2 PMI_412]